MTGEPWVAVLCGIGVAAASALIALLGLRWSASRPGLVVAAVLGGTLVRLLLVIGCSVFLLGFTNVAPLAYATSLIVSYLGFLGIEIFLILRKRGSQTQTQT